MEPELQKILRPAGVKEVNPSTEIYDEKNLANLLKMADNLDSQKYVQQFYFNKGS